MKIIIYELLGMIKDGNIPKKIYYLGHYYTWKENDEDYQKEDGLMLFGNSKINYILNTPVEIIEEEKQTYEEINEFTNIFLEGWKPFTRQIGKLYDEFKKIRNQLELNLEDETEQENKIPEKIPLIKNKKVNYPDDKFIECLFNLFYELDDELRNKVNEIIDYLKNKEGENNE